MPHSHTHSSVILIESYSYDFFSSCISSDSISSTFFSPCSYYFSHGALSVCIKAFVSLCSERCHFLNCSNLLLYLNPSATPLSLSSFFWFFRFIHLAKFSHYSLSEQHVRIITSWHNFLSFAFPRVHFPNQMGWAIEGSRRVDCASCVINVC